jgi:aspartyl protease family protein
VALSSGLQSLIWQAGAWAGVYLVAVAVLVNYPSPDTAAVSQAVLAPPPMQTPLPPRRSSAVELKATGNGHYHARVDINGRNTSVLVDTGASIVVLTSEDARRAGIFLKPSDYTQPVATANGVTRVAPVTLDRVSIGDITVRDVRAAVAEEGRLNVSLLGMSFLSKLERVDMRDGVMVLND